MFNLQNILFLTAKSRKCDYSIVSSKIFNLRPTKHFIVNATKNKRTLPTISTKNIMFRKFKYALIAVLIGLNIAPATAKTVQIPNCRLDQSTIEQGWFVQIGDIGKIMAVQSRLPPGATLFICKTTWFKNSKNYQDVVIEVGKFKNPNNAKKFGKRIWLEVSDNVVVSSGPPSGM